MRLCVGKALARVADKWIGAWGPPDRRRAVMDTTTLMVSLLFGALGMGYFMFGKKERRMVPLFAGVLLMVVPYFIANVIVLVISCVLLTAVPFVVREG